MSLESKGKQSKRGQGHNQVLHLEIANWSRAARTGMASKFKATKKS